MEKILSIVIPTYNMEKYLHNCLSSLLIGADQYLLDVIVVNDGSKDSSLSIAREYESKYPGTFRVIDKENGNYGSCVNRGLKEALGKYIKILDADDSYDTDSFHRLVGMLRNMDVDLCLTDYVIVDEERKETGRHIRGGLVAGKVYGIEDFLGSCLEDMVMMHEITYRTDILRDMQYKQTEGIAFTDSEWSLLPLPNVKKACYLDLTVYRYLVGRVGQTVDIKRAAALQPQGDKTMFVQIEAFSKLANLQPVLKNYMTAHIKRNLRLTYRTYMITSYKGLSNGKLKEYDERLKRVSPELYQMIENERVQPSVPLHFIHLWRKAGGNVPLSIKLYRTIVHPLLHTLKQG